MSLDVYKNMLLEEIDRKQRALVGFNNDIVENKRMPIYLKKIQGRDYVYINDGIKGDFHYKLLGNVNSFSKEEMEKLRFNSNKYQDNLNKIKEIKDDLVKLKRMVNIIG